MEKRTEVGWHDAERERVPRCGGVTTRELRNGSSPKNKTSRRAPAIANEERPALGRQESFAPARCALLRPSSFGRMSTSRLIEVAMDGEQRHEPGVAVPRALVRVVAESTLQQVLQHRGRLYGVELRTGSWV